MREFWHYAWIGFAAGMGYLGAKTLWALVWGLLTPSGRKALTSDP